MQGLPIRGHAVIVIETKSQQYLYVISIFQILSLSIEVLLNVRERTNIFRVIENDLLVH
jgi:hypothetical protein